MCLLNQLLKHNVLSSKTNFLKGSWIVWSPASAGNAE